MVPCVWIINPENPLTPLFERCVVLNLDERPDRWGAMKAKLASFPELGNYQRVRAINGNKTRWPSYFISGGGAYGCKVTHTRILEDALMDEVQCLAVFEDDACFTNGLTGAQLQQWLSQVPTDWAMMMLGGQPCAPSLRTEVEGVLRATNCQRTHAFVVKGGAPMQALYKLWSRSDRHIDHLLPLYQAQWPVYHPERFFVGQDEGPSNISGRRDAIRFWTPSAGTPNTMPLYLLTCPRPLMEALRYLGLHNGNWRDPITGKDMGLMEAELAGWPADKLNKFADVVCAEAFDNQCVPALWHDPMPPEKMLQGRLNRPGIPVVCRTIMEALVAIPQLQPAYRAQQIIWCWRGHDVDILEGLAYHCFHRGNHLDEVTRLDQGVRLALAKDNYGLFRQKLVPQLRKEASTMRFGRVLLAHPELDMERLRGEFPEEQVVELVGTDLDDLLQQFQRALEPLAA